MKKKEFVKTSSIDGFNIVFGEFVEMTPWGQAKIRVKHAFSCPYMDAETNSFWKNLSIGEVGLWRDRTHAFAGKIFCVAADQIDCACESEVGDYAKKVADDYAWLIEHKIIKLKKYDYWEKKYTRISQVEIKDWIFGAG